MPTWTGNILQTYKVYREEDVRIRNSEIDCRMRMYDNLQYQSIIVRFERIVSGRLSPLTAPLPLTRPPAPAPLPLHRIFSSPAPAHPVFGPAPLHFPLPLRSHVRPSQPTWAASPPACSWPIIHHRHLLLLIPRRVGG